MIVLTVCVLGIFTTQVQGACENLLSEDNPLELKDDEGKVVRTLTRCRYLVDDYPELCKEEYGDQNGVCCKLCWSNNLNCIDSGIKRISWVVNGKKIGCKDYIKGNVTKCFRDAYAALLCCKSCREALQCTDFLSENQKIIVTVKGVEIKVTSCQDVVSDYLVLCRGDAGKKNGACCQTCSKYDLTCIDNTLMHWTKNDQMYNCAEYVAKDPCHCENEHVAENCCASCKGKVCAACRDFLSEEYYINVTRPDTVEVSLTDCSQLINNYLSLCLDEPGQPGGHCCQSCKGKDLSCVDNALYTFNVLGKKQGCAEYVAADPCRCEEIRTASNCCASCQDKVCDKCSDSLSSSKYIDVLDKNDVLVERLTDCKTLTDKYLYLCKRHHGKEGGECCESCSMMNLSCIDDGTFGWPVGDKTLRCAEYVALYPDKCQSDNITKQLCCASCEDVDGSCTDNPDFKTTIKVKVKTDSGKKKINCKGCSCDDIRGKGKQFVKKACKNKKKRVQDNCCKLCGKPVG